MGTPFLGEIRIISWNFPPRGWAFCNGQLLPINQNQALFSILGTMYGGDGRVNFALPDLRGRGPIHTGGPVGAIEGQKGGEEFHTVTMSEMPAHSHVLEGSSSAGTTSTPTGNSFGTLTQAAYASAGSATTLEPTTITFAGGSQPHENRQPFLVLNYIVALQGTFPSQN